MAQAKISSSVLSSNFSMQATATPSPLHSATELQRASVVAAANKTALYDPQSGALNLTKIGKPVSASINVSASVSGATSSSLNRPVSALSQSMLLSQSASLTQQPQLQQSHQSSPDRNMRNKAASTTFTGVMSQDLQR